jgi:hypothetical protein
MTGIIASCGSIERLSHDRILPPLSQRRTKWTNAPYLSIIIFTLIGLAMYGVVRANLEIISGQFVICFLVEMALLATSNLLLKVNRDRLVRSPRVKLPVILAALAIVATAVAGNIVLSPVIAAYFAAFFTVSFLAMTYTGFRGRLATALYWIYNRNTKLHSWRWTRDWHLKLIDKIKKCRTQPIVFFAKTDEVQ